MSAHILFSGRIRRSIYPAIAEEDLECGRWLLWDSVASYEALVLCGASSGVIKLWNPLSRSILQTGQARNRENAAAILLSLCKGDNEKLVAIGRLGAVVPLMDLTENRTERSKRKATSLLELLRKACQ
ncbi:hypothetical protein F2Q69_00047849 [Brassica cretica]|uniref:Uncharacterized protein n=1 Tax=Brassica cretica TaxID=69181 RepID=A0A8S9PTM3_BRACR|nr:hypothetical protein F2Q69_00047849 [Brassica cretica]